MNILIVFEEGRREERGLRKEEKKLCYHFSFSSFRLYILLPLFKQKYVSLNGFLLHRQQFHCVEEKSSSGNLFLLHLSRQLSGYEARVFIPFFPFLSFLRRVEVSWEKIPWNLTFVVCLAKKKRMSGLRVVKWNRTRVFERILRSSLEGIEFSEKWHTMEQFSCFCSVSRSSRMKFRRKSSENGKISSTVIFMYPFSLDSVHHLFIHSTP